jgi:hypothetical protein
VDDWWGGEAIMLKVILALGAWQGAAEAMSYSLMQDGGKNVLFNRLLLYKISSKIMAQLRDLLYLAQ